jgi:uncharacterized protein YukE
VEIEKEDNGMNQEPSEIPIGFTIPGVGSIEFSIPLPIIITEEFSRQIVMDFPIINDNLANWITYIDQMEQALIDADLVVHIDLRFSWQGNDAMEFFAAYDPMYKNLTAQLARLREMAKLLRVEIDDFGYMQQNLRSQA